MISGVRGDVSERFWVNDGLSNPAGTAAWPPHCRPVHWMCFTTRVTAVGVVRRQGLQGKMWCPISLECVGGLVMCFVCFLGEGARVSFRVFLSPIRNLSSFVTLELPWVLPSGLPQMVHNHIPGDKTNPTIQGQCIISLIPENP